MTMTRAKPLLPKVPRRLVARLALVLDKNIGVPRVHVQDAIDSVLVNLPRPPFLAIIIVALFYLVDRSPFVLQTRNVALTCAVFRTCLILLMYRPKEDLILEEIVPLLLITMMEEGPKCPTLPCMPVSNIRGPARSIGVPLTLVNLEIVKVLGQPLFEAITIAEALLGKVALIILATALH